MRTTITLDDELLAAAKRRAADRRQTLSAVISDALREAMARTGPTGAPAFSVSPVRTRGYRPGVDITDGTALRDLMDEV